MNDILTFKEWSEGPDCSEKTYDMSEEQKIETYNEYCRSRNYWPSRYDDDEEFHINNDITCN